nr:sensor domain-containing diguanylate cyclase [Acuticoccus kalidii]
MLKVPTVGVSVVNSSKYGFSSPIERAPLSQSDIGALCREVMEHGAPLRITDVSGDPRFASADADAPIGAFAAVPLLASGELPLGVLWVMNQTPHAFDTVEMTVMKNLARCVVNELLLRERAALDDLTGLMRRRPFMLRLKRLVDGYQRHHTPATLSIFDLDFFKSVNDRYGHQVGDAVLARVADLCRTALGPEATTARLGGEEFAVAFSGVGVEAAAQRLRRFRSALAHLRFDEAPDLSITASFGVCALTSAVVNASVWCRTADAALYGAKAAGRNQILVYHPAAPSCHNEQAVHLQAVRAELPPETLPPPIRGAA